MPDIGRSIILFGILLIIIGAVVTFFSGFGSFPKLPGDIYIKKGNFIFYFPWVTSIVISIILSLIFYLFSRK